MSSAGLSLFEKISSQELITPYLEIALSKDDWPESLNIPLPEHGSKTDDYFHPSSHCDIDDRELFYRVNLAYRDKLEKMRFSMPTNLSMIQGTILHVVIQQKLKQDGWITDVDIERPLVNEELHARGHLDLLFPKHPVTKKDIPVDIKTTSKGNFDRQYSPYWKQRAQLNCYMDWLGCDEGVILLIEAGYPFRMKEFLVQRDELLLHSVYSKWKRVRQAIEQNQVPDLCAVKDSFCTINSDKYKSCPARVVCEINDEQRKA